MNLFQRFSSWVISYFKRPKRKPKYLRNWCGTPRLIKKRELEKKKPKYKGYCQLCKAKRGFPDYFYCKYCRKYHCEKHRLPEKHKCSGKPKLPPEMRKGGTTISYSAKKQK